MDEGSKTHKGHIAMATYGYARVSTADQDLTVQREALKAAGCEIIREEKISGTSRQGRKELQTLLEFLRKGDTLGRHAAGSPRSIHGRPIQHRERVAGEGRRVEGHGATCGYIDCCGKGVLPDARGLR